MKKCWMLTSNKFSVLFAFLNFTENSHLGHWIFYGRTFSTGHFASRENFFFFFSTLNTTSYCVCQLRVGGRPIYRAGYKIVISYSLPLLVTVTLILESTRTMERVATWFCTFTFKVPRYNHAENVSFGNK
jgi:hypothetical protein